MPIVFIFFGGYNESEGRPGGGRPISPPRPAEEAYRRIRSESMGSSTVSPLAVSGSLDNSQDNPAVNAAWGFLSQHRPQAADKLVIYGYSAGGFNALRLSERIAGDREMRAHRIDLLITVDPCLKLLPGHVSFSQRTPNNVGRHVNYYQLVDHQFQGCSMLNAAVDQYIGPRPTRGFIRPTMQRPLFLRGVTHNEMPPVTHNEMPRDAHNKMPNITLDAVQAAIREILR